MPGPRRSWDLTPCRGVCAAVRWPCFSSGRGPGSDDGRGGDRQLSAGQLGPDLDGQGGLVGPFLSAAPVGLFTGRYGRRG